MVLVPPTAVFALVVSAGVWLGLIIGDGYYWAWFCVLALLGIYLPNLIAHWAPELSSLILENLSMAVRFALAWAFAVTAWLMLTSVLGRLGSGATAGRGGESAGSDAPA